MQSQSLGTTGLWGVGDLIVDVAARMVLRGGTPIDLPRLSFDLFVTLIDAAPDALSTDELMDRVWRRKVVSASTVAKRVELLRQALGDDAEAPRYVALVRGYGYQLARVPESIEVRPGTTPKRQRRKPGAWAAGSILLALGLAAWWWMRSPDTSAPPEASLESIEQKTIAVLPFIAIGGRPEDQHFADGLTEEFSHALAQIGGLRVSGRTSADLAFRTDQDASTAGRALGVAHVLTGTVRREGDQLSVVARLVSTSDGFQRWSERYEDPASYTLEIQKSIAEAVAGQLEISLGPPARSMGQKPPLDPAAYALYLEARGLMPFPRSPEPQKAIDLLEAALARDPEFSEAWSLLAAAHLQRLFFRDPLYALSPDESLAVVRDATERARAIDPRNGMAHAMLGNVAWLIEEDDIKAARHYEQAVRLAPWELPIISSVMEFARSLGRLELS